MKEYIKVIKANPEIPVFIIRELNTNPTRIQGFPGAGYQKSEAIYQSAQQAYEEGRLTADLKSLTGGYQKDISRAYGTF